MVRDLKRCGALALAGVLALTGCGAGHHADAHSAPPIAGPVGAITIRVGAPVRSRPIKPGFLGFSFEYQAVTAYAGRDPAAIDPVFVQLIRNVTPLQRPVIRIGGDTTDSTWWPLAGERQPPWVKFSLSSAYAAVVHALAQQLDAKVILGINLEANSRTLAGAEARRLIAGIGSRYVAALEPGNEPELYGAFPWYIANGRLVRGRPRSYGFRDFIADFRRIAAVLPHSVPLVGPATGSVDWIPLTPEFLAHAPRLIDLTLHLYPLQLCFKAPSSPMYPTFAHLLARSSSTGLAAEGAREMQIARARGVGSRVDEMSTISCGYDPVLGHSFASALWMLDALFAMAQAGADGVNIHSYPGASYDLFSFIRRAASWSALVAPQYYGLMMFARAAPPGSELSALTSIDAPPSLRAWATAGSGASRRVTLINEGPGRLTVSIVAPRATAAAAVERLRAPSLGARAGVTLDGQSFGAGTTTGLLGPLRVTRVAPRRGRYVITLPGASATLVTIP